MGLLVWGCEYVRQGLGPKWDGTFRRREWWGILPEGLLLIWGVQGINRGLLV